MLYKELLNQILQLGMLRNQVFPVFHQGYEWTGHRLEQSVYLLFIQLKMKPEVSSVGVYSGCVCELRFNQNRIARRQPKIPLGNVLLPIPFHTVDELVV